MAGQSWIDRWVPQIVSAATLGNLGAAALALVTWLIAGPSHTSVATVSGYGLDVRLDGLSVSLVSLVAFVALIVARFSHRYLAGDARRPRFVANLCLTAMAVSLLVLAGNLAQLVLAWIGTSVALHRLLLVFGERPGVRAAARRKFIVARLGDACLLGAAALLVTSFATAELGAIAAKAAALTSASTPVSVHVAAGLLVLAAALKSAQFPVHGWLLDVIEAPTPVSALLHAGLINAGGFLLVRFADVLVLSGPAMFVLASIGALTALFGSLAMLTQTSVKLSLAYSTVAQMGFMLFQCGLGAFASATLHLVAHSLYKAHAFSSSGSVVDKARARIRLSAARPSPTVVLASFAVGLLAFVLATTLWQVRLVDEPAIVALGSILVLTTTHLVLRASTIVEPGVRVGVIARTLIAALLVSLAYFALQRGALATLAQVVPEPPPLSLVSALAMVLAVVGFALVTAVQWLAPARPHSRFWQRAYVQLKHGLHLDALHSRHLSPHR